jgi:hypothetical protein
VAWPRRDRVLGRGELRRGGRRGLRRWGLGRHIGLGRRQLEGLPGERRFGRGGRDGRGERNEAELWAPPQRPSDDTMARKREEEREGGATHGR